ncbi:MAG: hypothetical protein COA79_24885 [Planctomycetota bacterium]|nr:MAG: hypothetical protein COA79_24885 [Planctomycetota bacterium]
MSKKVPLYSFEKDANNILNMKINSRVNSLGGYGVNGEVIYVDHPIGCPSVLADKQNNAKATFMSNGSIELNVLHEENNKEVHVLKGSFDAVEKKETGPLSNNIWLTIHNGKQNHTLSLLNSNINKNVTPASIKIIKRSSDRSMWYCNEIKIGQKIHLKTALKIQLIDSGSGPVLLKRLYIKNLGNQNLKGTLWAYLDLQGTQYFAYNKSAWYDAGLPLSPTEQIISASVPYSEMLQIKRVSSSSTTGIKIQESTCDYQTFIGNTSKLSTLPEAVIQDKMLTSGAGKRLSRFCSPVISAVKSTLNINKNKSGVFSQSLTYITDTKIIAQFLKNSDAFDPTDKSIAKAFQTASKNLITKTRNINELNKISEQINVEASICDDFYMDMPHQRVVSEYANSVWTTVEELYENCRAHGANLADGIELGTRDRGQDMWPKIKENPGIVRQDLIHALGFMFQIDDKPKKGKRLELKHKLHGMFPRQFPSAWINRKQEIFNDNRPYNDSPIWLVDSLNFYIRETGDTSILKEKVGSVTLTDPEVPEKSGMVAHKNKFTIAEVILGIFECYKRHADDSAYGMIQILYGDWCDPVDMFGTSIVGNDKTRGIGAGVNVRLSAHVFKTLINTIELFSSKEIKSKFNAIEKKFHSLKSFANQLRKNVVNIGWEDTKTGTKGFLDSIHELKKNGKKPKKGDIGYTLGSYIKSREFDGRQRRVLTSMSWGLSMLNEEKSYLDPIKNSAEMSKEILKTFDNLFYDPKLGLKLFTIPIPNNEQARSLVGRMGMVPAGCAENGEYHHAQIMAHVFRSFLPGEIHTSWKQFKPMISATRDESLCGPFETPTTSYTSDPDNPHFGKGMYFGLSGSVDWIVNFFQNIAGIQLNLHTKELPDIIVSPNLPKDLKGELQYRRMIHVFEKNKFRKVPIIVDIKKGKKAGILLNGKNVKDSNIQKVGSLKKIHLEIIN